MVRRTLLRSRQQGSARHTTHPKKADREFKETEEKFLKAKKEYDEACVKRYYPDKSATEECMGLFKAGAKGLGKVADHLVDAAVEMGKMTERDLYDQSPAGARDRAIIKTMMERDKCPAKAGVRSKGRSSVPVPVLINGKWVLVDKSSIGYSPKTRRR